MEFANCIDEVIGTMAIGVSPVLRECMSPNIDNVET